MDRHRMRQRPVTVKNITFVQFLRRSKNRHKGAGECHEHSEVSSISFSPSFTDYFHSKAPKPRGCNQRQRISRQGLRQKCTTRPQRPPRSGTENPSLWPLRPCCEILSLLLAPRPTALRPCCAPFLLVGPRIGLILFMIARWFRSFPYASHNLDSG